MAKNQNDRISKLETKLKRRDARTTEVTEQRDKAQKLNDESQNRRDARITELTEQRDKAQKLNEESRDGFGRWHAAFAAWLKRVDGRR
jgi:hypothetical protein